MCHDFTCPTCGKSAVRTPNNGSGWTCGCLSERSQSRRTWFASSGHYKSSRLLLRLALPPDAAGSLTDFPLIAAGLYGLQAKRPVDEFKHSSSPRPDAAPRLSRLPLGAHPTFTRPDPAIAPQTLAWTCTFSSHTPHQAIPLCDTSSGAILPAMRSSLAGLGRFADPALLVLGSLATGPRHGYAITQDVRDLTGITIGPGTLYGVLARLERRGWIRGLPAAGRRHPYELTAMGREILRTEVGGLRAFSDALSARAGMP